ncbi:MAG: oligosaccharide flippase family protein [Candidatus Eisenbacteria bacterium]
MRSVLVRNVLANVVGRSLSILTWLALTPWVLRALGPDRFGFWSLLSTLATTALLLDLGLGSAVTKYVAEYGEDDVSRARDGAFTAGVLLASGLALLWGVAGFAGRGLLLDFAHVQGDWQPEAWMAAGIVPFAAAAGLLALVPSAALAGLHRIDLVNRIALLGTLVQAAASIWVLRTGGGLPGLMWALLSGSVISLVVATVVLHRIAPQLRFDLGAASGGRVLEQLRFSAALQIISLGVLCQFQLPKFALARWSSLASVGEFDLGYRVAFAAWSLPSLILPPLLPALSQLTAQGRWDAAWALYERAGRYLLIVALPIASIVAATATALYVVWLGPGHTAATLSLVAIASLLGINVLTSAGCLFARAIGRPWMEARYHLLSLGLHVALLVWWVPRFGLAGGLGAMLVSGTVGTIQYLWVFHHQLARSGRHFITRIAGPPAVVALVGAGVAWAVCTAVAGPGAGLDRGRAAIALVSGGAAGALVVLVGSFAARVVSRAELLEIVQHLRQPRGAV